MLDVEVSPKEGAYNWDPQVPTLAIRVFDVLTCRDGTPERDQKGNLMPQAYFPLKHMMKKEFVRIEQLIFDDVERDGRGFPANFVPFNTTHATAILDAFDTWKDKLGAVYVHCVMGLSRSPAIALALREIYGIHGPKWDALSTDFITTRNRHVLITMLETADERRQHYRTPPIMGVKRPPNYLPKYRSP